MTSQDPPERESAVGAPSHIDAGREALQQLVQREPDRHPLVLAFVAPLGTPLDAIERSFGESFRRYGYEASAVRLSELLDDLPYQPWGPLPARGTRDYYTRRMDAGDRLRADVGNGAALAALAVARVAASRHASQKTTVYILRSLKHPSEVELLRHVFGDAFSLVAVSSSLDERRDALIDALSLFDNPRAAAEDLIARDEEDLEKEFGQHVRDVYSMADVYLQCGRGLDVSAEVDRFVDAVFGAPFITPRPEEEAMRLAFDASLRSAAAGRQVGAALVPVLGTPVVVGTNEVPKPGGGQYWSGDNPDYRDFNIGTDPNPLYTRRVVQEVLERLASHGWLIEEYAGLTGVELLERATKADDGGASVLAGARASALIEFTRCLHAEQAVIVNAARAGVVTDGATLFTSTFPCHECAKMIIGAGIVEVHYIEPYPKSLVGRLYRDLIETEPVGGTRGLVNGMVPFRQYVGIAPRRYSASFLASERRAGSELVEIDRLRACPRTNGWSERGVADREAVVVKSIDDVLAGLAAAEAERAPSDTELTTPATGDKRGAAS